MGHKKQKVKGRDNFQETEKEKRRVRENRRNGNNEKKEQDRGRIS